jgi:hypothetical protein
VGPKAGLKVSEKGEVSKLLPAEDKEEMQNASYLFGFD